MAVNPTGDAPVFETPLDPSGADALARPGGVDAPPEILAFDWASDEGRFVNELDRDVFVLTDRYDEAGDAVGIVAVRVPPGGTGRGDAVIYDSALGGETAFKVPNSRDPSEGWTIREGLFGLGEEVVAQTPGTALVATAAEAKNPLTNDYGPMTLDHFQRIMGNKPIIDEATGDVLRPAPDSR